MLTSYDGCRGELRRQRRGCTTVQFRLAVNEAVGGSSDAQEISCSATELQCKKLNLKDSHIEITCPFLKLHSEILRNSKRLQNSLQSKRMKEVSEKLTHENGVSAQTFSDATSSITRLPTFTSIQSYNLKQGERKFGKWIISVYTNGRVSYTSHFRYP